jgi:hypothetical protein
VIKVNLLRCKLLRNLPDSDIKRALQEIPEEFRIVVYLADVEGFSYKEIAEIVGSPAGTVMSRLHRGRKQLREKLADYAKELGYTVGGRQVSYIEIQCGDVLASVVFIIEGELQEIPQAEAISSHLITCGPCAAEIEHERAMHSAMLQDVLKRTCDEQAPEDLHQSIHNVSYGRTDGWRWHN